MNNSKLSGWINTAVIAVIGCSILFLSNARDEQLGEMERRLDTLEKAVKLQPTTRDLGD